MKRESENWHKLSHNSFLSKSSDMYIDRIYMKLNIHITKPYIVKEFLGLLFGSLTFKKIMII